VRNYWHVSFDGATLDNFANKSERVVTTSVFH
jgi:hypothetical protein